MSQNDVLADVVSKLDAVGVPHMLAGSFASSFHGIPRTTNDIDFVIDPTAGALDRLLQSFDPNHYYADSMFNVIHLATGWKIDFIVCKARAFSRSELTRREHALILGVEVFVATPEDTVLAKLEWAKLGESERQLRDVRGVMDTQGTLLDRSYIEGWVDELGVRELWARVTAT